MPKLVGSILLCCLAFSSCNCGDDTTMVVTPSEASIVVGKTLPLIATVTSGSTIQPQALVQWVSDNAGVARVDASGLVSGVAPGFATISATSGPARATANITVTAQRLTVSVTPTAASLAIGESTTLRATVRLDGAVLDVQPQWQSDQPGVAQVDAGVVTGRSIGVASISASYGNVAGQATITVARSSTAPSLTCLDPPLLEAGDASPPRLFAYATRLTPAAFISLDGVALGSSVAVDSLTAFLRPGDVATARVAQVTVSTSEGVSNPLPLPVLASSPPALISVTLDGGFAPEAVTDLSLSHTGRYVAFQARGPAFAPDSGSPASDVLFIRDTCRGADAGCVPSTRFASSLDGGDATDTWRASEPSLSADGRYLAFTATRPGQPFFQQVYMRDLCVGAPANCQPTTALISIANDGGAADDSASTPVLSASGRYVTFLSAAPNLRGRPGTTTEVYLRDLCVGALDCGPSTQRVSVTRDGGTSTAPARTALLAANGRVVVFISSATDLTPDFVGPTNENIFVRDTCLGAGPGCTPSTSLASAALDGGLADNASFSVAVSGTGRFVAFGSSASNLVAGDVNTEDDLFLRDTCVGAAQGCTPSTVLISQSSCGLPNPEGSRATGRLSLSADGRYVGFTWYNRNDSQLAIRDTCAGIADCRPRTWLIRPPQSTQQSPLLSPDGTTFGFLAAGGATWQAWLGTSLLVP
jgi:Bacterial Ig-like domain (group 2)/WD40-like Beta Propeller Repeat